MSFVGRYPVVFQDERVLIIDKPIGARAEHVAFEIDWKLVHRIDKPTSGLLVLARDARAVQLLQRALRDGDVERTYLLVAHGRVASGRIESTLVRDRGDGLRGSGVGGKTAVTDVDVIAAGDVASFARATLHTGRTHQIRIHLAELGHPLVGEPVYVRDAKAAALPLVPSSRLLLHAWRLRFVHPMSKQALTVTSPLPADFVSQAAAVLPADADFDQWSSL